MHFEMHERTRATFDTEDFCKQPLPAYVTARNYRQNLRRFSVCQNFLLFVYLARVVTTDQALVFRSVAHLTMLGPELPLPMQNLMFRSTITNGLAF